jgi:ribosomal protein S7
VEKLPGVTKDDMALIALSKKPVEAREKLAERLLFGQIIDTVMKKRGATAIKQKQEATRVARANFIASHKSS